MYSSSGWVGTGRVTVASQAYSLTYTVYNYSSLFSSIRYLMQYMPYLCLPSMLAMIRDLGLDHPPCRACTHLETTKLDGSHMRLLSNFNLDRSV